MKLTHIQAIIALAAMPLGAQSPDAVLALARGDSLLTAEDWAGLATMQAAVHGGSERALLRALQRVGQWGLTGSRGEIERALFDLNAAASSERSWSWPRYLSSRVHLLLNAVGAPALESAGQLPSETHVQAATRHLVESLRRDPELTPALQLLISVAYAAGDREPRPDLSALVDRYLTAKQQHPLLLVVEARWARIRKQYAEADSLLRQADELGADPSIVALERARTVLGLGDTALAAQLYWRGLEQLTSQGRELFHQDLALILSDDSLTAFDAVPQDAVPGWLQRFWDERDVAAGNQRGGRLTEHLRRWVIAHEKFRVPTPWRRTQFNRVDVYIEGKAPCVGNATRFLESLPVRPPFLPGDMRFREPLLDHRGLVYLHHGEPYAMTLPMADTVLDEAGIRAAWQLPAVDESVEFGPAPTMQDKVQYEGGTSTWVYWIDGGWRTFNFQGSNVFGASAPTTLVSYLPAVASAWQALERILPAFVLGRNTCSREAQAAIRRQRSDAWLAIDADSDTPPVAEPWKGPIEVLSVGAETDRTSAALVTFAIPTSQLRADTAADGRVLWPVSFRLSAFRLTDGTVFQQDTTRQFIARPVTSDGFLTGLIETPLEPGEWNVSVRAWQGTGDSVSAYVVRRGMRLETGTALGMSDLVLGAAGGHTWNAADDFPINTLGTWRRGGSVELWYQVWGIPAETSYRSQVEILTADDPARVRTALTLESQEQSTGSPTVVQRSIGLAQLDSGRYRLAVVITDPDGGTVRREREIVILR